LDPETTNRIAMSPKKVVFVCTANYYRSRFCEHWFNAQAEARGLDWQATSRGLRTWMADGYGPIASYTVERLAACGIRLDGDVRFPLSLSESDLEQADLVVALKEGEHRAMMAEQFPAWADRIEYWHVDDIDCATADEALPLCETNVLALVARLADSGQNASGLRWAG
jgi:protein-tyrosine phosphatase